MFLPKKFLYSLRFIQIVAQQILIERWRFSFKEKLSTFRSRLIVHNLKNMNFDIFVKNRFLN